VKRGRGKLLATISSSTPRAQTKPHKEGKSPLLDSARITTSQHNLTKPCLEKPRDHNIKNRKFQSTGAELSRLSHDVEEDFLPVPRRCPGLAGSSVLRDLRFLPLHPHDVEDFLPVVVLQVSWQQVALAGVRVPDHEAGVSTDTPRDDGVGHRVGDHCWIDRRFLLGSTASCKVSSANGTCTRRFGAAERRTFSVFLIAI
jgi:hypothetical protein